MINNLLILISILLISVAYLRLYFTYIQHKTNKNKITGFEAAKEMTSNYDEINIVESKKILTSQYHLKRQIIRLTPHHYEDTSNFTIAIMTQLAGYSLINIDKNKYIDILKKIIPTIDWLNKSAILSIIIALLTNTITDAKLGILLLSIILIYQYFIIQITMTSNLQIEKYLKKQNLKEILKINQSFYFLNKISFITTLILILKEIIIILQI